MTRSTEDQSVATIPTRTRRLRLQTFTSLKHRDYRLLWSSTLFASAAQWIQQVTLGWLVFDLTGSYLVLGAVNAMRSVPFIFVGPLGGVIADRMDRKRLLQLTQVFLCVTAIAFATVVSAGLVQVWHIFVFTLLSGAGWAFNHPVRQAIVPKLVPREDLMNAIALNSAAFNINRVVGPVLGGILIGITGPGLNFYLQAVGYIAVFLLIIPIRPLSSDQSARQSSLGANFLEGLTYVFRDPNLRLLIILAAVPWVFFMPYSALLPGFAVDVLHLGPSGLGMLYSVVGVGALGGTLALASAGNFQKKGLLLITSLIAGSVSLIIFSQSSILAMSLVFLALTGGFQMVFMSTNNTLIQLVVPDALRGRVVSIFMLDHG
ncbi:MAG: MFS transporter, partial [Dehalococcoidia bacterium]